MKKCFKILVVIVFLPALFFGAAEAAALCWHIIFNFKISLSFLAGCAAYGALHFYVYNFSRPYVAAHEVMHALAALFFGYKVKGIKVSENSGSVKLDDYNDVVILAPYIFPLYFLVFGIAVTLLLHNGFDSLLYRNIYSGVFGFLFAFHIIHTVKTVTETKQPDIKMAGGAAFSLFCIAFFNLLFLVLFLAAVFPEKVSLAGMFRNIFYGTLIFWQKVINYTVERLIEIFKL